MTLTVDQIRKELSLLPRGIREEKEKSMAENEPRCKHHPDRPAVVCKSGRSLGQCKECIKQARILGAQRRYGKSACRKHPEKKAVMAKNGRSMGFCEECLADRARKTNRIKKSKSEGGNGHLSMAGRFRDTALTPPAKVRTCRVCGCTDEHACPGGCSWVQEDLCSACQEELEREIFENHSKNKAANSINIYCMKCGFHMQIEDAHAFRGGQS